MGVEVQVLQLSCLASHPHPHPCTLWTALWPLLSSPRGGGQKPCMGLCLALHAAPTFPFPCRVSQEFFLVTHFYMNPWVIDDNMLRSNMWRNMRLVALAVEDWSSRSGA